MKNTFKFQCEDSSHSGPELIWEGGDPVMPQMTGLFAVSCAEEDKYCMWCR